MNSISISRNLHFTVVAAVLMSGASAHAAENTASCAGSDVTCVAGNVKLDPNRRYSTTLKITSSNTTLDCNGAVIDLENRLPSGIEVDSLGSPLSNVEIRNCTVLNARANGIMIGWSAPDRQKAEKYSKEDLYRLTPTDVRLRNVSVRNAGAVGIYLDDYVTHALIDQSQITGSGSVGIYIEHSSRWNTVQNSVIAGNGVALRREGIAIDSSLGNKILHNQISGNFAGGVYLYRNCSEHYAEDPKQARRWQSSDQNTIEQNDISGGRTGVWVASRQSMDVRSMQCGNPYYGDGKYSLDSAKHNNVVGNSIRDTDYGVIVEDNDNLVQNNTLTDVRTIGIKVGSIARDKFLNQPVTGTQVIGNRFVRVTQPIATVGDAKISGQQND